MVDEDKLGGVGRGRAGKEGFGAADDVDTPAGGLIDYKNIGIIGNFFVADLGQKKLQIAHD